MCCQGCCQGYLFSGGFQGITVVCLCAGLYMLDGVIGERWGLVASTGLTGLLRAIVGVAVGFEGHCAGVFASGV